VVIFMVRSFGWPMEVGQRPGRTRKVVHRGFGTWTV